MKKILLFLAVVGLFSLQGCTEPEGPPGVPGEDALSPEAFEIKNIYLSKIATNEYNYSSTFQKEINGNLYDDETVLIYRMTDLINSSTPVWQLLPRTINFSNGDFLEYYFDFSKIDFVITAYGNYNLLNRLDYVDNQTFRIVILPSKLATTLDKNNFNAVMSALNIKENDIQKINF